MYLELSPELEKALPAGQNPFEWFLKKQGTTHREVKHRLTYETRIGEQHVFVKRHLGCGWREVLKEWYRLRKPVVSARTEWEAAETLAAAGLRVPRVVGKGERGPYPHKIESFVALEALENCETLEHFKEGWLGVSGRLWIEMKRGLLREVAETCRKMHAAGVNHRDLYINHFLINRDVIDKWQPGNPLPLYLIDLHRVQRRAEVPDRWLIKDLSALLFSAMDTGLQSTDYARFLSLYLGPDWKDKLRERRKLWQQIRNKAKRLYKDFHQQEPNLPNFLKLESPR